MDSPQSVVSPFKGLSIVSGPEKQKADPFAHNPSFMSSRVEVQSKDSVGIIGALEVYIHQARDTTTSAYTISKMFMLRFILLVILKKQSPHRPQ